MVIRSIRSTDIRNFFKSSGGAKKRPTEEEEKDAPAQKKAKTSETAAAGSKAAAAASPASRKSPARKRQPTSAAARSSSVSAKSTKAAPSGGGGKARTAASAKGRGAQKKLPIILDSDDEEAEGSDWKADSDAGEEEEEEGEDENFEIDLTSSDEEPAPKKARGKATRDAGKPDSAAATPTQKRAAASAATPSAGKGRALPKSFGQSSAKLAAEPDVKQPTPKRPAAKAAASTTPKPRSKAAKKDPLAELPEDARAAIAAVNEAAKKLPQESELNISVMEGGDGGFGQRPDDNPPNAGAKELPRGHPDALTGKAFVVTGVLDSMERPDAEDYIKRHGGRITTAVSGKTDFLVAGNNCGKSKITKAHEKNVKVVDEDGLLALVRATVHLVPAAAAAAAEPAAAAAAAAPAAPVQPSQQPGPPPAQPNSARPPAAAAAAGPSSGPAPAARAGNSGGGDLWVTKHKPKESRELVGNGTTIATLRQWLECWEAVHVRGEKPNTSKLKGNKAKDFEKKAVLLSGPPGIGKTSSAMIITSELGFLPIEVNASDTRNKSDSKVKGGIGGKLSNSVKELATNTAIGTDANGRPTRTVLVMDEVDGMSAGDRGGVADLIQTIHKSKIPIIAICNDKYNQKLKSLRNHCLELEYRRPTSQQITARMLHVARSEGLNMNEATMRTLVESCNGDLRLMLGQLQMIRLRTTALAYDDVRKHKANAKDADMSPFEAARKLLDSDSVRLSIADRVDLVFQDPDLVPLLIQENYVNHRPTASGNDMQLMQLVAKAAEALSMGDQVNRRVRQYQTWTLMPFANVISSVYPAAYMRGPRMAFGLFPGEMNFPRFSAWFGANSSSGKQRRLLGELHTRMAASGNFHSDRSSLRLQYLPTLRSTLIKPLVDDAEEGVPKVIEAMHDYCMARDDLDYLLDVTKFKTKKDWNDDPMKSVPTALKSAFTRNFNKQQVAPRTNIMVDEFKPRGAKAAAAKKGRRRAGGAEVEVVLRESEEEAAEAAAAAKVEEEDAEEEEEEDSEALQKRLAATGVAFNAGSGSGAKGGRGRGRGGRGSGGRGRGSGRK